MLSYNEFKEALLAEQLDEVHVSQKDWEEDQALKSRPSKFDAKYNGKPEAKSKHYVSQKDWEEDQALKSRPSKFDKKLTKEEVEMLESLLGKLDTDELNSLAESIYTVNED